MAGQTINIGKIEADLDVNSGNMIRGLAMGEQALDKMMAELRNLDLRLKSGAIGMADYVAQTNELQQAVSNLASRMQSANSALPIGGIDLLNKKMEQGKNSSARMAQGLMQLGYMADDAQYGISALVNNIGPLVYNLTGNAGLAAAAQVAMVAANQFGLKWSDVQEFLTNTQPQEKAIRSLEAMQKALKALQEDANSLSFGDQIAQMFGSDRDAGKAAKAADMEATVKAREKAEANAKKQADFEPDEKKKEIDRFNQAVGESGGANLHRRVGEQRFAKQGPEAFLDNDPTWVNQAFAGMVKVGQSNRAQYKELADKKARGEKLTHDEFTRLENLKKMAEQEAIRRAEVEIGGAAGDKDEAVRLGNEIGGPEGDVIAGRKNTKKQDDENAKQMAGIRQEADDARKKAVKDALAKSLPRLKDQADRLAAKVASGQMSEDEARESLSATITESTGGNLLPEEVNAAAKDAFDQTSNEDADKRARRLRNEATAKAKEALPDLKERADALAARVERGQMTHQEAHHALKADLSKAGLSEDDSDDAAEAEEDRTNKEDALHRQRRMRNEAMAKAKEASPDIEDKMELIAAQEMAGMGGRGRAMAGLDAELQKRGMGDEERTTALKGLHDKATESVSDRMARFGNKGENEGPSRSEVYATSSLTEKVQGAISNANPEAKKHTSQNEKVIELLTELTRKAGNGGWEIS